MNRSGNRPGQPDIHPDTDSLNALVERVLPEAERARVVAHLAGCRRCREVVYLAQAAAGIDEEAARAVAAPVQRGRWFPSGLFGWRVAWVPAVALAAIGGVLIWVHMRQAAPPAGSVAQLAPPPPVPAAEPTAPAIAAVAASPGPAALSAQENKSRPASKPHEMDRKEEVPRLTAPKPANPTVPVRQQPMRSGTAISNRTLPVKSETPVESEARQQEAIAVPAPVPVQPSIADAQRQSKQRELERAQMAGRNAIQANSALAPAPPPSNTVAVEGAPPMAVATGAPQSSTLEAQPPAQLHLAPQPLNGVALLGLAKHRRLPSGLNVVSSAIILDRLVALDSAGSVFLSHDAGKHWEAVTPQWAGRAIEVQAPSRTLYSFTNAASASTLKRSTAAAKPAEGSEAAAPSATTSGFAPVAGAPSAASSGDAAALTPAMLFQLVTDRHQTWVSADGKIWHAR